MRRPVVAVPVLALALAVGGCGGSDPAAEAPADAIVMTSNAFEPGARTIQPGQTITLVNETTGALHILVMGDNGVAQAQPGAPDVGGSAGHRSERGDVWTTPAWTTPGEFKLTCTVHPDMTLAVTVAG